VQPVHLASGVLVVELRPRPISLQAAVLVGVEQAVEVEARRPLVLRLQDRLGVVQALISSISASLVIVVSSPRLRCPPRRSSTLPNLGPHPETAVGVNPISRQSP
jgi:hypothetical protein